MPSDLSGLALWLMAGVGQWQDTGGNTPATNTNDPVARWDDQSGQGNNLLQSVSANRPLLKTAEIGSYGSLLFDGVNDELTIANVLGIGAESGRTFIVVSKLVSTTKRCPIIAQGQGGSTTYYAIESNTSGTSGSKWGYYVTATSMDSDVSTDLAYKIVSARIDTMTVGANIIVNSAYRVAQTPSVLTLRSGGGLVQTFAAAANTSIGRFNGSPVYGNCYITEVIVYDRSLSLEELQNVEGYLATKFSL